MTNQTNPSPPQERVELSLTIEQAAAVNRALDVMTRLGIGQLDVIADLVREELIPMASRHGAGPRQAADLETCEDISALMDEAKGRLGHPSSGSHGIGHAHNHEITRRAYEVHKVLAQALARHRNPNPTHRGVDYFGLTVRYTTDPVPTAAIINPQEAHAAPSERDRV